MGNRAEVDGKLLMLYINGKCKDRWSKGRSINDDALMLTNAKTLIFHSQKCVVYMFS